MTVKLWELSDAMRDWLARLDESDGELTPELEGELDELHADWGQKISACCFALDELQARAQAFKAHVDALKSAAKGAQKAADGLKGYMHAQHLRAGKAQTVTGTHVVNLVTNGVPSLRVDCELEDLPEEFVTWAPKANKGAIADAIKSGEQIAGCTLEKGTHLRVRVGSPTSRKGNGND